MIILVYIYAFSCAKKMTNIPFENTYFFEKKKKLGI